MARGLREHRIGRRSRRTALPLWVAAWLVALAAGGPGASRGDEPPAEASPAPTAGTPTPDERMVERGFVRYRNAWRTKQEIELIERAEGAEREQRQWAGRVERLRRAIDDPAGGAAAAEELRGIRDPRAVPALAVALSRERVSLVRGFLLEALAGIGGADAWGVVVKAALDHPDVDTRYAAAETLAAGPARLAEPALVTALAGPDNARINRAAEVIGLLRLAGAAPALVRALETEHVVTVSDGRAAGQTSVTFGNAGGEGLSLGGGPKRGKTRVRNEAVRAALELIAGENHGWDVAAWRVWLERRDGERPVDLRRGD